MRSYTFTASTDFGAFDGSCTHKIREIVENSVLKRMFTNILGDQSGMTALLREAMQDRTKEKCDLYMCQDGHR